MTNTMPPTHHDQIFEPKFQARAALAAWAVTARNVNIQRDMIVKAAWRDGISKAEIFRTTGIARTTIDRILTSRNK